jgi:hypothetical protein
VRIVNEPPERRRRQANLSLMRYRHKRLLRRIGTAEDGACRAADGRARANRRHREPAEEAAAMPPLGLTLHSERTETRVV